MVNLKKISMAMLASLALFNYGCGGGGGGGGAGSPGTPNAAPATQAAGSASKAVSTALNLATAGMNGTVPTLTLKSEGLASSSDTAEMGKALKSFKAAFANRKAQAISFDQEFDCEVSGKFRITIEDHDTPDPSDDTTTTTYTNCSNSEGSVTNGSLVMTLGGNVFSFDYDNFVTRTTFSGAVSETTFDGGMSFVSVDGDCGMESATMTDNLTLTSKFDQTGDGTFEINSSFAINMTMILAQAFAEDCTPGANTITLNGGTTTTNSVNSQNDVVTFTNFTMVLTPETRVINGVETDGDTLSLNGTIEISSSCTDDTIFTITTTAGEEPFIPEEGDSCPLDGRFIISNGGSTVAVIYTSTGGVQIDEGNNGSIDDSFASCDDAEAEGICTGTEV